ncbi:alpha/beta hydrolase [Frigidibacter sp. MR17.14]|uniref:alpha/beta fold hydrolase n=1 Tax=Frigidibacter sp. MR17.14 TaxID=3126509 RepID=UPI003012C651
MTRILMALACLLAACAPLADRRAARIEARNPPQGQFLEVAGTRIHAEVRGHGPDVVLLHGASGSARDMDDLARRLQDRYRVISFDRPGLGYSGDLGTAGLSPLVQADYLRAAAAQLGVREPIVLGHSYGGAVAMAWALIEPKTRGVVVVSGAVLPWEGGYDGVYGLAASPLAEATLQPLAAAFMPDWLLDHIIGTLFAPQPLPPDYAADTGAELALRPGPMRTNLRQLTHLKAYLWRMGPHYRELTLPIEIVQGSADRTIAPRVHAIPMTALPNVHLTLLPGVGHMAHHAAPEAVIAAIDRVARRGRVSPPATAQGASAAAHPRPGP